MPPPSRADVETVDRDIRDARGHLQKQQRALDGKAPGRIADRGERME